MALAHQYPLLQLFGEANRVNSPQTGHHEDDIALPLKLHQNRCNKPVIRTTSFHKISSRLVYLGTM